MNVPSTYSDEVKAYFNTIKDEQRLNDCLELTSLMIEITGEQPKIWQKSIVGFGSYHYKYESGREGDWILTGFSSRKLTLSIYIISGFEPHLELLEKMGKHKTGTSCLYAKQLSDLDQDILKEIITSSVQIVRQSH
tara:strand:- start:2033 stop:2440 length:408 start_codon:yes stop_codon:yes gene_type:complete